MRWRAAALALLALGPALAALPGLQGSAGAGEDPLIHLGQRAYVLAMQENHFNGREWPDTPLLEAYEGERMRLLIHVPITAEMHTFHLHGHPWIDPGTGDYIDAVRLDAGESHRFNQTAGLAAGHAGDWFYHCHVSTHFDQGMWGLLRVYPYAMQVIGDLDGLTVTLADDGEGLEQATFDARLRQGPDQVTGATVGGGEPVDVAVTELGDGRYHLVPELDPGASGELVLVSHHDEGESLARLDLIPDGGYEIDRDVAPPTPDDALDALPLPGRNAQPATAHP